MNPTGHIAEIRQLVKRYPTATHNAVDGISLTIERGEIYGLLGPNGAGKTTTLSVICGLMPPTGGSVRVNGHSINEHPGLVKRQIGVVPQEIALYEQLTAKENLLYMGHMFGMSGKALRQKVDRYLERFGLTEHAGKRIHHFSGGMKRRANLIAAILHDPQLLIMDEPTVGIDVHSRNVIMEFLTELNRQGTTILYTSHHLNEAEKFCHRIGIIDHGKLITEGQPKALIDSTPPCQTLDDLFLHLTGRQLRD